MTDLRRIWLLRSWTWAGAFVLGCGSSSPAPSHGSPSNTNGASEGTLSVGGASEAERQADAAAADVPMNGPLDATADAPIGEATTSGSSGDSGEAGDASEGGVSDCSASFQGGVAQSTGYAGTSSAYFALFESIPCVTPSDCVPSCVGAGGTASSCETGSLCLPDLCSDGGDGCPECLPPTYWLNVAGALGQPGSGAQGNAAYDVQAFDNGYNDTLEVEDFGVTLPEGAVITGIAFDIDRQADDNQASDESVRVLENGVTTGLDHASSAPWPESFTEKTYGGPGDTWGVYWTPAGVAASVFGIAITPQFLGASGNDRVQIDSVSVTVYYAPGTGTGCP